MSETTAPASDTAPDNALAIPGEALAPEHDDPMFAEVPESAPLPPAVTGQSEIAPDVTAQDLGVNTEPDPEPEAATSRSDVNPAPAPLGTVLTDGGDGVAPAEVVELPGRERSPPHQPPAHLTEEEIAAKVAGRAEADAALAKGPEVDPSVKLRAALESPGYQIGAVIPAGTDRRIGLLDAGLRQVCVDRSARIWAIEESEDDINDVNLRFVGTLTT